ncbi:MAG: nucleotidyltransferase [Deltaproteobacteria bacterium]|nr:nucleotidyltransferase [Deltaproteobacteria bacterium]
MSKSEWLQKVLESSKQKHIESEMKLHLDKKDAVKNALQGKFGDKMVTNPINSGSYAKKTHINQKFDLDFCIPFKYNSFDMLKEMSDKVYKFLKAEYQDTDLSHVRQQRNSIGMSFRSYDQKQKKYIELDIDVVPGRELQHNDYTKTYNMNLYVNADSTSIKTNIKKHIELISGKNKERQIIRLLKVLKLSRRMDIKSFLLELITIRAFQQNSLTTGLWEQLKMTMEFIRDNIQTIALKDPANSNNNVADSLTYSQKLNIQGQFSNILKNIYVDKEDIKTYFPKSIVATGVLFTSDSGASRLRTNSFG